MNKKRFSFCLALLICLHSTGAWASNPSPTPDENTLIKEVEFTTTIKPFSYTLAQKSIREKNREYFLQDDISYTVMDEQQLYVDEAKEFTRTQSKQGLSNQDESVFPDTVSVHEDGYDGELQRKSVSFQAQTIDGGSKLFKKTIAYGYQVDEPTAPESITTEYKGKSVTLAFDEMTKTNTHWQENHLARVALYSPETIYTFDSGRSIDLLDDVPKWQGLEFDFFKLMKLDAGAHIIQSAQWDSGLSESNGELSASIVFTMKRLVSAYTAVYSAEQQNPDHSVYDATAQYTAVLTKKVPSEIEYSVKATLTYYADPLPTPSPTATPEPTPSPTPEPIVETKKKGGGGMIVFVIFLAIAGVGGYFALKWKQKRDSET